MKITLSILVFVCLHTVGIGQQRSYLDIIKQSGKNAGFEKVRTDVNSYFDSIPDETQKNKRGYKLWKRWEWFANLHQDADGRIGDWNGYGEAAFAKIAAQPTLQATNGSWSSVGPASISNNAGYLGRVECVAFHPSDANTLYIGSGSGGVWKTTNLGSTWTAKSDYLPSLSIGGLAVHPSNGNIVYALSGDGDGGNQWGYYVKARSAGVFKSTDGGDTWAPTGLTFDRTSEEEYGYKLIINPSNGNNLFAATSAGIWRTTDGGANWTQEITGEFTDIEFRPNNSNHLVATAYGIDDLYLSTDNGLTWRQKDVPGSGMTRADLAVSANTPNNVYMLMGPEGNGNFRGYYRFLWTDSSFTLLTNTPNVFTGAADGSGDGGFAWWAIGLGVSPSNANNQLVGGVIGRRSTDGGAIIVADNDILHADQHGYWYSPVDGSVFATNDGGIMRSTNNGSTWTNITVGLRITQFYRISGTNQNVNMILGGTQDNGHYVRYASTSEFLHTLTCCDGMDNAVDPTNSQIIYMCSQNGGLVRSIDGETNWTSESMPEASSCFATH